MWSIVQRVKQRWLGTRGENWSKRRVPARVASCPLAFGLTTPSPNPLTVRMYLLYFDDGLCLQDLLYPADLSCVFVDVLQMHCMCICC